MTYTIGEVEELSGIKQNILRYWETVIPGFAPRKDLGGRRVYTERDFEIVLRLKHLIYERKFTIEGARKEILHESQAYENNAEAMNAIRELRTELTQLYFEIKKGRK
ncbi:MAG: MerR family transcriptional regulator [Treponema sp.]|uniref:MerR family transcriptional regulator n=1 Tax=Treponema sp. TaxID=166 RepID=UPI001B0E9FF7|nr:MerR family transcriptional regulator [Treponema sp.]MBO6219991.1 MerR family transcriptional regulator [Treponema sp.]MBQ8680800.1 MerR family transcriptional regulator [Treponema sp.]